MQLVPNLPSIQLVDGNPAAFKGLPPPSHHHFTPIHAYLQEICQDCGASFADGWLDTAHITFATLAVPADKVQSFAALLHAAARHLPDLSTGCYKIVDLQHYDKRSRRDAAVKGSNFYYLDLESSTPEFVDNQLVWLDALKSIAQQVRGSCKDFRNVHQQHMTVRSFSLRDATESFHRIRKEVQGHPTTMHCAGIRVQQPVDQALDSRAGQGLIAHAFFYTPQARYPVCLYSSCMQASYHVRLQHEQMQRKQKAAAAAAAEVAAGKAAVQQVLEQLVFDISHCSLVRSSQHVPINRS